MGRPANSVFFWRERLPFDFGDTRPRIDQAGGDEQQV